MEREADNCVPGPNKYAKRSRHRARIEEDEALFAYAENTVHFYNHLICVHQALQKDDEETARREFQKAAVFAERLKKDTKSTQFASSHANAPNALEASYVTRAYSRYLSRFAPPPTEPPHVLRLDDVRVPGVCHRNVRPQLKHLMGWSP